MGTKVFHRENHYEAVLAFLNKHCLEEKFSDITFICRYNFFNSKQKTELNDCQERSEPDPRPQLSAEERLKSDPRLSVTSSDAEQALHHPGRSYWRTDSPEVAPVSLPRLFAAI